MRSLSLMTSECSLSGRGQRNGQRNQRNHNQNREDFSRFLVRGRGPISGMGIMLQHPVAPILGNPALVRARVSVPGAYTVNDV